MRLDWLYNYNRRPMQPTPYGIHAAVTAAGSQQKLAELLGVTQQVISTWCRRGYVPVRRAQEIEATLGVPRSSLISPRLADLVSTEVRV